MSDRLQRSLVPAIKVLSTKDATVEYVASDATLDCYNEILVASGARFDRFSKNAPFVDSHDYSTIERLLGSVESFEVKNGQVIERVKWAVEASALAALGFKLTESGHLKAVSVGFLPVKMLWRNEPEFAAECEALKLPTETVAKLWCIHKEWMQIELSACIIGANPNALAKAFNEGALKERELAAIGFAGDEEFDFLQKAGAAYEGGDEVLRGMIRNEMSRIYRARELSPTMRDSKPRHHAPGGDDGARRQAEEQEREALQDVLRAMQAVPRL